MTAVRGDHDDNKSRIRTERAQERIKLHPFKRHGSKKKKERQDPKQAEAIAHVTWMLLVAFSHVTYAKMRISTQQRPHCIL